MSMLILVGCGGNGEQSLSDESANEAWQNTSYKIEFTSIKPVNEIRAEYSAGETVTIKLETLTEHYYVVKVNGAEIESDSENSNLEFTYFVFTMPNCDVTLDITEQYVSIPYPPNDDDEFDSEATNINLLTGIADLSENAIGKRPVAIMVNNIPAAMPQYGIEAADVIFEIPVEGYQTRLMCIYADYTQIPRVCSVRSCRKYFPALALGFDAIYVNCGQFYGIDDYVNSLGIVQYDGGKDKNGLFQRDQERIDAGYKREHTLYFDAPEFPRVLEKDGVNMNLAENKTETAFKFNPTEELIAPAGEQCTDIYIDFGSNESGFSYNSETKTYFKTYYDKYSKEVVPQYDGKTNNQLQFTNLFILHNETAFDKDVVYNEKGDMHRLIDWKGGKDSVGYYISNGVKQQIYWVKENEQSYIKFYDMNGNELSINRGKTYICFNDMEDVDFN